MERSFRWQEGHEGRKGGGGDAGGKGLRGRLFSSTEIQGEDRLPRQLNGKEPACNAKDQFDSWAGKIRGRRDRLPTPVFLGSPGGSADKEFPCNAGDLGLIPGFGRSPGEGSSYLSSILAWRIPWTV